MLTLAGRSCVDGAVFTSDIVFMIPPMLLLLFLDWSGSACLLYFHRFSAALVKEVEVSFSNPTLPIPGPLQVPAVIPEVDFVVKPSCEADVALPMSDPAGQITPSEPLEVNRPVCSAVDSDESMPPNESGHDSFGRCPLYHDYGALDSSAVSHAFAAAFQLESHDQRKEDELFARQAINGTSIKVAYSLLPSSLECRAEVEVFSLVDRDAKLVPADA
ncbi:hypothetical protein Nepgr_006783 [Nepenthes gracilis]|uniref:Uncharacterized protein n=1 Tax=Nepenthes gracilis TaxID=150966 RepID=A0AAD3S5S4_NEPGR|nr:hypothetical protein Nepgr_006783 [Nepenthes gracilis]